MRKIRRSLSFIAESSEGLYYWITPDGNRRRVRFEEHLRDVQSHPSAFRVTDAQLKIADAYISALQNGAIRIGIEGTTIDIAINRSKFDNSQYDAILSIIDSNYARLEHGYISIWSCDGYKKNAYGGYIGINKKSKTFDTKDLDLAERYLKTLLHSTSHDDLLTEREDLGFYYWITPDGKIHRVPVEGHEGYVKMYPSKFGLTRSDCDMVGCYTSAYRAGAIRVGLDPGYFYCDCDFGMNYTNTVCINSLISLLDSKYDDIRDATFRIDSLRGMQRPYVAGSLAHPAGVKRIVGVDATVKYLKSLSVKISESASTIVTESTPSGHISLWLDDERNPRDAYIKANFGSSGDELWVKTASEAIEILQTGLVYRVSLDHDLGDKNIAGSGMDVVNFIEEAAYNKTIPPLEIKVHSQNSVANPRMKIAAANAIRYFNESSMTVSKDDILMLEGGAAGHMSHLYDDKTMTFAELKALITDIATGNIQYTEKLDGQNIQLSYDPLTKQVVYARNRGQQLKLGATIKEFKSKYEPDHPIYAPFIDALNAFDSAVKKFSPAALKTLFGDSKSRIFYNCEIVDSRSSNVIKYDINSIVIHTSGHVIATAKDVIPLEDASKVELLRKQLQQSKVPNITVSAAKKLNISLPAVGKASNAKIASLQRTLKLGDSNVVGDLVKSGIVSQIKKSLPTLSQQSVTALTAKVLGDDSTNIDALIKKYPDMLKIKMDVKSVYRSGANLYKKAIRPLELIVNEFAMQILKNVDSEFIRDPSKERQRLRAELAAATKKLETVDTEEGKEFVRRQLEKINADMISSVEGIVVSKGDKVFKISGVFAGINQLLGAIKFGKAGVQLNESTAMTSHEACWITANKTKIAVPNDKIHSDVVYKVLEHCKLSDEDSELVSQFMHNGERGGWQIQELLVKNSYAVRIRFQDEQAAIEGNFDLLDRLKKQITELCEDAGVSSIYYDAYLGGVCHASNEIPMRRFKPRVNFSSFLGSEYAVPIMNESKSSSVISIVPGSFKPPHSGHWAMIKHYAKNSDVCYVIISDPKNAVRSSEGGKVVTAKTAKAIFEIYAKADDVSNVEFVITTYGPVQWVYEYVGETAPDGSKVILGVSDKGDDAARYGNLKKYQKKTVTVKIQPYTAVSDGKNIVSASDFRNALDLNDPKKLIKFLPSTLSTIEIKAVVKLLLGK